MNAVLFVLDANPIFPSSVQFPVCASCSRTSCDRTDCVKTEKRMLLV